MLEHSGFEIPYFAILSVQSVKVVALRSVRVIWLFSIRSAGQVLVCQILSSLRVQWPIPMSGRCSQSLELVTSSYQFISSICVFFIYIFLPRAYLHVILRQRVVRVLHLL